jgi:DtxR family transcriptional regulator, Mn-dependent transcriptional regulator
MSEMPRPAVTRMVEDYVTLIWKAREWPGREPSTTDLAASLGVTPSTVSANLKKLARDGYISYEPYGRIDLTPFGNEIAVEIVRRHRLIETYLVSRLGMSWDQVHGEADRLEHAVSDVVLDRMDDVLGNPTTDPHGDPIPARDGSIAADASSSLADASPGDALVVTRVSDRSPEVLRHLAERGLTVGTELRVASASPAASSMELALGGTSFELSLAAASAIRVTAIGREGP